MPNRQDWEVHGECTSPEGVRGVHQVEQEVQLRGAHWLALLLSDCYDLRHRGTPRGWHAEVSSWLAATASRTACKNKVSPRVVEAAAEPATRLLSVVCAEGCRRAVRGPQVHSLWYAGISVEAGEGSLRVAGGRTWKPEKTRANCTKVGGVTATAALSAPETVVRSHDGSRRQRKDDRYVDGSLHRKPEQSPGRRSRVT